MKFLPVFAVVMGIASTFNATARDTSLPIFSDARLSAFDTRGHVLSAYPHLSQDAEAISHWSAYYRLNPFLLTEVVQARYGQTAPGSEAIRRLAQAIAAEPPSDPDAVASRAKERADSVQGFARRTGLPLEVADTLLKRVSADTKQAGFGAKTLAATQTPPALDLPFSKPQSWQFNGVHSWTGDDDGSPMSSLDFTRTWQLRWGDETANDFVSAAHDGVVTVYSSCFVQIRHESGWATRYYHLDNLQVSDGQTVRAGDALAIYSNSEDQALCSGGRSTGPHLHFALLKDGAYYSLEGVELSGYAVNPGDYSYDRAAERMWLEKRGIRYFAFNQSIRTEQGDNTIDYRYNGLWFFPESNGHGLNIEVTEFPTEGGTRQTVSLVIYTYDDDGQANFYVGNVDFDRWRSDEAMEVPLLQTAGGGFSTLRALDFSDPAQVRDAGIATVRFLDCSRAVLEFDLDERSSRFPVQHTVNLRKLTGVPDHVCRAASVPLD